VTTYPLSEPATIYRTADQTEGSARDVVARGSLSDCAEILEGWSRADRASVEIEIDDMSLRYGPDEVEELLTFLRKEHKSSPNPV
jgi:hypothetical protein